MTPFLLPQVLGQAAARFPERPAVMDSRRTLTYAALAEEAGRLASTLQQAGVRRGDRVALFLDKSVDAIAAIYGILTAGAAYVPLDPAAPPARLAYILRDCAIRCAVSAVAKVPEFGALAAGGALLETVIIMDGGGGGTPAPAGIRCLGREALDTAAIAGVTPAIDQDLAYILYTSGSTGQPKGVMLSHRNALTFVHWAHNYFRVSAEDVLSNHAPLHFDLTILDIFVAAMAGATLAVVPGEASLFPLQLARFIEERRISIWYSVPSALTLLLLRGHLQPGGLPSLRHVIFAGEIFPTKHLRALMRLLPHAAFTNLYGPTETNVCTYYRVPALPPEQTEPIPIGEAIENVEVTAITEDGRRAFPGEVGELYVRGGTVALGYWGDPERTARVFVADPTGRSGDRMYRTGDLVRQHPDGPYAFLGRRDHQIKSRGYRIELGDIEAAFLAHPGVGECAVIAVPDEVLGNRLRAFVVRTDPGLGESDLIRFCTRHLPRYMVPEAVEFVREFPRTSTGKVDRRALAVSAVPASRTAPGEGRTSA